MSISSPIPGMPNGKPAGERCRHLDFENRCALYGKPERPEVCSRLQPLKEMCGDSFDEAFAYLQWLERVTSEDAPRTRVLVEKKLDSRDSV